MRKTIFTSALVCLLSAFTTSEASATYVTIENIWNTVPILQPNVGGPIWYADVSVRTNEFDLSTSILMCSADYCTAPGIIPIGVTHANQILIGQTFTSQLLPGVPEDQFFFTHLGVGGNGWFTGADNVGAHFLIRPGVAGSDTVYAMWPFPDPAPVENPYFPIAKITFHPGAPVINVGIKIKPNADEATINLASAGVIPVAILSSPTFDATQIVASSVSLAGAKVKLVGKAGRYSCSAQDIDADGRPDLVCHVETAAFFLEPGESMAILEAETTDHRSIRGQQLVRIVP